MPKQYCTINYVVCAHCGKTFHRQPSKVRHVAFCNLECRKASWQMTPEKFWARTTVVGTCQEWTGARTACGYGMLTTNGVQHYAHRTAWEFTFGPIPTGLEVCHKCDNPACCNPTHLFLATHAGNLHDAKKKGRFKVRPGDKRCKLTRKQALEIRNLPSDDRRTLSEIASAYGIAASTVHQIRNNQRWKE